MMSSKVPLGKAIVKLEDLLSKCEIHQAVQVGYAILIVKLMEPTNPRKATGASLEILIRMRAPLIKANIVKNSEKWLEIAFGQGGFLSAIPTSTPFQAVPLAPLAANPLQKPIASKAAVQPKLPVAESSKSKEPQYQGDQDEIDDEIEFLKYLESS
jgi:hypothetical protein